MSTERGNVQRQRPQKYMNATAFKNNAHHTSSQIVTLNELETPGLCHRCRSIIEWKVRYKKYKPLTNPRTWWVSL